MDRRLDASAFNPDLPLLAAKDLVVYGQLVKAGNPLPEGLPDEIKRRMWMTRRASYATPEQLEAAKAKAAAEKPAPAPAPKAKAEVQFTPATLGEKAADGTYPILGPDGATLESVKPKAAAEKRLKEVNAGLRAAAEEAAAKAAEEAKQEGEAQQ
jgi:hypothetical protein